MIIGLPREIKNHEYRVGLTPAGAGEYVAHGHTVLVETNAGAGSAFTDEAYRAHGCAILSDKRELFDRAEMIVKVKEPLPEEFELLQPGRILFTYLHLAAEPELAAKLLERRIKAVAYETIVEADGTLPLLAPMSQIAGRLSIQIGATWLQKSHGGRGVLLGGVPGVPRGRVLILGAGVAGQHACRMAVGLDADVVVMDIVPSRLNELDRLYGNRVQTLYAHSAAIAEETAKADLVVGAVLVPGAGAPKLVTRTMVAGMKKGSVIVDIAIDQGGCVETARRTTHDDPIYRVDGVIHYCVANMPGAVSLTATHALVGATNRYGLLLADQGLEKAVTASPALARGLNCYDGVVTHPNVAAALDLPYHPVETVLKS